MVHNYFLWPYRDEVRLRRFLGNGKMMLDLRRNTPGFSSMKEDDRAYICLPQGRYVFSVTLAGSPYLLQSPLNPNFPFAVNLKDVKPIDPPVITGLSPRGVTLIPGPIPMLDP
jgi:hypothetical protein